MMAHTGENHTAAQSVTNLFRVCTVYSLRMQVNSHWGKPPSCAQCNKSFFFVSLKCCMFCQTSEKQHNCTKCDKSFGSLSSLKKHMMIHTDIKTTSCSECGRSLACCPCKLPHSCLKCDTSFCFLCSTITQW